MKTQKEMEKLKKMVFNQKEYNKKWRKENPKKIKGYNKKYYKEHREELNKKHKKWRKENPEKVKEQNKKYREENKKEALEYHKEYSKKYYKKNKDKKKEYSKKWEEKNPNYRNNYMKKYSKTEKGKINYTKGNLKRRTLKKKAKNTLTKKEIKIIQDRDKKCVYCGSNKNLQFEHIIPLNKGGENSFLNGVMACKSCNSSKRNKDVFEWCKSKGYKVPKIVIHNLKELKGGKK